MKNVAKKTIIHLLYLGCTFVLTFLYYKTCVINDDMAGSILEMYKSVEWAGKSFCATNLDWYNIWKLAVYLIYEKIGINMVATKTVTALFFGASCFLTFELVHDPIDKKNQFVVPLVFFLLIPGITTNKFHYASVFVTLLEMLYLKYRSVLQVQKRKKIDCVVFILSIFIMRFVNDKLLLVSNVMIPLIIYGLFRLIKSQRTRKKTIVSCCVFLGIASLGLLVPMDKLTLYGASEDYLSWATLGQIWGDGLEFYFVTIIKAMNISMDGALISFQTLYTAVRLILLLMAYIELCLGTKEIWKTENTDLYWVVVCGASILSSLLYLFNGRRISLYTNCGYANEYCGYMSIVWFTLVILAVQYMKRLTKKIKQIENIRMYQNAIRYIALIMSIVLSISTVQERENAQTNVDKQVADYLMDHCIEGGISYVGPSYLISVMTGGATFILPQLNYPEAFEFGLGYRSVNAFVESISNNKTNYLNSEKEFDDIALKEYGEWNQKEHFYEDSKCPEETEFAQERLVYIYDRDIRWPSQVIKHEDLVENGELQSYMALGENKITIQGKGLSRCTLELMDSSGHHIQSELIEQSDGVIEYRVWNQKNDMITWKWNCTSDTTTEVYKITNEMQRAAIELIGENDVSSDSVTEIRTTLPVGESRFVLLGNDFEEIQVSVNGAIMELIKNQNGRERKIWKCTNDQDGEVIISIHNMSNHEISISDLYLESTVEDRQEMIKIYSEED